MGRMAFRPAAFALASLRLRKEQVKSSAIQTDFNNSKTYSNYLQIITIYTLTSAVVKRKIAPSLGSVGFQGLSHKLSLLAMS
jgi:hypothetical protein